MASSEPARPSLRVTCDDVPTVVDDIPAAALAIYAHPDDPEVSCGGTLARWAAAGSQVYMVICARGDKGSADPAVEGNALAARRRDEVAASSAALGLAGWEILDHDDGELEDTRDFRRELVAIVRRVRPDAVICPDPTAVLFGQHYFNHRDHRVVGFATLDAVAPAAANPHYFPDAGPGHHVGCVYLSGTLEPDAWIDITTSIDTKAQALLCHQSRVGEADEWLPVAVRQRAEESGRVAGVRYAEAFRRLLLPP
jgi:LmbE family N-acetylglucosaminyl deacetylase